MSRRLAIAYPHYLKRRTAQFWRRQQMRSLPVIHTQLLEELSRVPSLSTLPDLYGHVWEILQHKANRAAARVAGCHGTPWPLAQLLTMLLPPCKGVIYDPCAGSGRLLLAAHEALQRHPEKGVAWRAHEQDTHALQGFKDYVKAHQLPADCLVGDSLSIKSTFSAARIYANPPFAGGSNKLVQWLNHIYRHLTKDGAAAIILPSIACTVKRGPLATLRRDWLRTGTLYGCVFAPAGLFTHTTTAPVIWLIGKAHTSCKLTVVDARHTAIRMEDGTRSLMQSSLIAMANSLKEPEQNSGLPTQILTESCLHAIGWRIQPPQRSAMAASKTKEFLPLGHYVEVLRSGIWGKAVATEDLEPALILRGPDISKSLHSGILSATTRHVSAREVTRFALGPCDLVVARSGNAQAGACLWLSPAFLASITLPVLFGSFCIRLRAVNEETAWFLQHWLTREHHQGALQKILHGTAITNLDVDALLQLKVPLPSEKELNESYAAFKREASSALIRRAQATGSDNGSPSWILA